MLEQAFRLRALGPERRSGRSCRLEARRYVGDGEEHQQREEHQGGDEHQPRRAARFPEVHEDQRDQRGLDASDGERERQRPCAEVLRPGQVGDGGENQERDPDHQIRQGRVTVLLVPVGASVITFVATANSTLQLQADDTMRGRVMALYALVFLLV